MKKLFTFIAASLIVIILFAQSPEKMNFQAVVRDNNNNLITNTVVGIRITILQNSMPVYFETQKPVTNSNGLITIAFGGEAGFNKIDWANGPFFIKSEIDPKGGTNYTITGTSQLMSVPYAFHAQTASYLIGEDNQILKSTDKGVPSQNWSLFGNSKSNPLKDKLGTTDKTDLVFVTDNIERLRITSNGDINLKKSFEIGEDLTVKRNVFLNTESGETINNGPFTVKNNSPTLLTGSLDVVRNSNLMSDLHVGGNTHLGQNLTVEGATNLNNTLAVNKGFNTHLTGDLNVDGKMDIIGNSSFSNVAIGGTLDVTGKSALADAAIRGKLDVTGATTLNNTLSANGQVTINYNNPSGDANDYNEYALRVEGSKHGIAIKSNMALPSRQDNFITFFDKNGSAKGRIEGNSGLPGLIISSIYNLLKPESAFISPLKTTTSLGATSPNPALYENDGLDFTSNYAVEVYQTAISWSTSAIKFAVNCIGAAAGVAVLGDIDDVVWSGVELIAETISWGVFEVFNTLGLGVAFESGGADYAEWLERKDINELLSFGEVVGVNGGLISKDFKRAEKYMVITRNPTIIGAMPDSANAKKYEKVAFMGQVPVKVIGKVKKAII
jgi:hypothetical protein